MGNLNSRLKNYSNLRVSQRPVLRLAGVLAFSTVVVMALITGSLSNNDVMITLTSGDVFLVDNNKGCDVEPHAAYVGFEICNTSLNDLHDINVVLGGFSNPLFGMAGGQDSVQIISSLEIGECRTFFWYTEYDCSDPTAFTDVTVRVFDGPRELGSQTQTIANNSTIDAGAGGKVLTSELTSDAVLREVIEFDCEYSFGSTKKGASVALQPAGNSDFHADCFQLVGSEVIYSEVKGIQVGDTDMLFYESVDKNTGSQNLVKVKYYFQNQCSYKDTTELQAYSAAISGINFKRYNLGKDEMEILPISWHWVKTEWAGQNGLISWGASGVNDSEDYTIERSENGSIFKVLGHFPAAELRTGADQFAYTDVYAEEVRASQILYRIRHVDIDGITTYSEIKELRTEARELAVTVFPNPTSDVLNIRYRNMRQEPGQMRIFNLNGQVLFNAQFGAQEDFQKQLDLSQWPSGKYFLEVQSGERRTVEGVLKM
jgi:hypothetical protein